MRKLNANEIEVKVKQINENGCLLLLYKTARVDMQILDEEFGIGNWQCDYKTINGVLYCGIGVFLHNNWVWKWDCGIESREDGEGNEKKGEASDAFKRAGFKWGIGRELYTAPFIWAKLPVENVKGKWQLKEKYPKFNVNSITYNQYGDISGLVIIDNKGQIVYKTGAKVQKAVNTTKSPATEESIFNELSKAKNKEELGKMSRELLNKHPESKSQIVKAYNDKLAEFIGAEK